MGALTTPEAVRKDLLRKLADRTCCDPEAALAAVSSQPLVAAYAELCTRHSCLLEFEAWARALSKQGMAGVASTSVADYYARSAETQRALGIWSCSPMSGVTLPPQVVPGFVSCIEMLRLSIMRDGYLWRQDAGGALLLCPPDGSMDDVVPKSFTFRTVKAPWRAVFTALPAAMYSRILVLTHDVADAVEMVARPGSLAEVVPVVRRPGIIMDRRVIVASPCSTDGDHEHWVPTPTAFAAPWCDALHSAMLGAHMLYPSGDGNLAVQLFVAKYAMARGLGTRVFSEVTASPGAFGEVVLIDSRPNVWSLLSVLVTLDNLQSENWAVTVFGSISSCAFMERCLLPHVPNLKIVALPELDAHPFDLECYNKLLKSPELWARIESPRALIVQDDGMIVRRGLETEFADYDYVGAPWSDVQGNAALKAMLPSMVGNGGISLRDTSVMREISTNAAAEGRRLFNFRLQPVPEDVFFATEVAKRPGGKPCSTPAAERFSMEERASPVALGFHKPWGYLPSPVVTNYYSAALREARARPSTA
jgi:hypothetical protein